MIGACVFHYNSPGCFLWADVRDNGRVFIVEDLKFKNKSEAEVAETVIRRTVELTGARRMPTVYAPPELFSKESKDIIESEAPAEVFARNGLVLTPCGSNHAHGWQRVHDYMRLAPDGDPWLIISPSCDTLIRTIQSLAQKKTNPDDVDGESYAAHALRVLLSARPSPSTLIAAPKKHAYGTVGWLRQQAEKKAEPRGVLARSRVTI